MIIKELLLIGVAVVLKNSALTHQYNDMYGSENDKKMCSQIETRNVNEELVKFLQSHGFRQPVI